MNMTPYTFTNYIFTIKKTPRGKYYCIVTLAGNVIYVSRHVHDTAEKAQAEAREHIRQTIRQAIGE